MFCRKCGKEIPDDSVFCPKCGFNLGDVSNSSQVEPVQSVQPSKSFDAQTQTRIDQLHKEVSAVIKPDAYGLMDRYALKAAEEYCRELKSYDDADFIANKCLADYYCLKLKPEEYRRQFDSAIECIRFALAGSSPNERSAMAERFYKNLLNAIDRLLNELDEEFNSKSARTPLLHTNERRGFGKQNASRDIEIVLSLTELTRIPYLSDSFLDKEIAPFLKKYEMGNMYQMYVWAQTNANSGGTFKMRYFRELVKNYPEYSNRSAKAKEYLDKKVDKNHTFRDLINVKLR